MPEAKWHEAGARKALGGDKLSVTSDGFAYIDGKRVGVMAQLRSENVTTVSRMGPTESHVNFDVYFYPTEDDDV